MQPKLTKPCNKLFHQFKLKNRIIILCAKKDSSYIKVGMSICNPEDEFNEKLGKKIAEARSNHKRKGLCIKSMYLNGDSDHTFGMYEMYLKQVKELIILNPEKYIISLNNKQK